MNNSSMNSRHNTFVFTIDAQCNIIDNSNETAHDALINSGDHYLNCLCV